jgi:hypothetical protein
MSLVNRKHWLLSLLTMASMATMASGSTKPVLNDWFALGSGCRAKSDLAGNVRMEGGSSEAGSPDRYEAKFIFKDFALSAKVVDPSLLKFGRECAVRLNINPPPGKRIVGIRAQTKIASAKDSGPTLDILSELKLGATSLGRIQQKLDGSSRVAAREDTVSLEAGRGAGEQLPQLGCGEAKIIGFDYSWIATRSKEQKGSMRVELGKEKSLVIEAILANCT